MRLFHLLFGGGRILRLIGNKEFARCTMISLAYSENFHTIRQMYFVSSRKGKKNTYTPNMLIFPFFLQSSHWIGTIILSTCELIERPSKKDGFCFKLFHPMDQSIWAARGPDGESIGAVVQPLPTSHCIFRYVHKWRVRAKV